MTNDTQNTTTIETYCELLGHNSSVLRVVMKQIKGLEKEINELNELKSILVKERYTLGRKLRALKKDNI